MTRVPVYIAVQAFLDAHPLAKDLLKCLEGCVMNLDQIYIQLPRRTTDVVVEQLISELEGHGLIMDTDDGYMLTDLGVDLVQANFKFKVVRT